MYKSFPFTNIKDFKCDGTKYYPVDCGFERFISKLADEDLKFNQNSRGYGKREKAKEKGNIGENTVEHELKWLGDGYVGVERKCTKYYNDTPQQCIILRDESFIDESQEYDHILISDKKVYNIETKSYYGKIIINKNGNWIREIDGNEKGVVNPISQVDKHHKLLSNILKGYIEQEDIIDIICIADNSSIIEGADNSEIPIIKYDMLNRFIENIENESLIKYDKNKIKKRIEDKYDQDSISDDNESDEELHWSMKKRDSTVSGMDIDVVRRIIMNSDLYKKVYNLKSEDIIIYKGMILADIVFLHSLTVHKIVRFDIVKNKVYVQIPFETGCPLRGTNLRFDFISYDIDSVIAERFFSQKNYLVTVLDTLVPFDTIFRIKEWDE